MGAYVAIQLAYSSGLKNEPILDLACVSAGLRPAGRGRWRGHLGAAVQLVPHRGLLRVAAGGHRQALGGEEAALGGDTDQAAVRQTLGLYTPSFLRSVRTLSAAVAVTAYCLWAFERASQVHPGHDPIWFQLTIIPFVLALLHVLRLLDSGAGAAPEELALRDHRLQLYGAAGSPCSPSGSTPMTPPAPRRELLTGWGRTAPTAADVVHAVHPDVVDAAMDAATAAAAGRRSGPRGPGHGPQLRRRRPERRRHRARRHLARRRPPRRPRRPAWSPWAAGVSLQTLMDRLRAPRAGSSPSPRAPGW